MFSPMSLSQPVTRALDPNEAMNRNASGTPPKLANTPDAVITTWRSDAPPRPRAVKIA